jgi:hypothetical protein
MSEQQVVLTLMQATATRTRRIITSVMSSTAPVTPHILYAMYFQCSRVRPVQGLKGSGAAMDSAPRVVKVVCFLLPLSLSPSSPHNQHAQQAHGAFCTCWIGNRGKLCCDRLAPCACLCQQAR